MVLRIAISNAFDLKAMGYFGHLILNLHVIAINYSITTEDVALIYDKKGVSSPLDRGVKWQKKLWSQ